VVHNNFIGVDIGQIRDHPGRKVLLSMMSNECNLLGY